MLVLSQYLQRDYAVELLESGEQGVGYLLKQRIADVDRHRADDDPVNGLTDRQRDVLELMAQGRQ